MDKRAGIAILLTHILTTSVFVFGPFVFSSQNLAAKKKALMVWGGDMHEPKQCVDLFAP